MKGARRQLLSRSRWRRYCGGDNPRLIIKSLLRPTHRRQQSFRREPTRFERQQFPTLPLRANESHLVGTSVGGCTSFGRGREPVEGRSELAVGDSGGRRKTADCEAEIRVDTRAT